MSNKVYWTVVPTLIVLVVAFMVGFSNTAQAGLLDSIATLDFKTKDSVKYKVDVYGYDARVYEFIPENNSDYVCIMLATGGDTNTVQMECIPRK